MCILHSISFNDAIDVGQSSTVCWLRPAIGIESQIFSVVSTRGWGSEVGWDSKSKVLNPGGWIGVEEMCIAGGVVWKFMERRASWDLTLATLGLDKLLSPAMEGWRTTSLCWGFLKALQCLFILVYIEMRLFFPEGIELFQHEEKYSLSFRGLEWSFVGACPFCGSFLKKIKKRGYERLLELFNSCIACYLLKPSYYSWNLCKANGTTTRDACHGLS